MNLSLSVLRAMPILLATILAVPSSARGRGYARSVMVEVLADILGRGETPMLHVFAHNHAAIRVYEGLGFTHRRHLHLAVLQAE